MVDGVDSGELDRSCFADPLLPGFQDAGREILADFEVARVANTQAQADVLAARARLAETVRQVDMLSTLLGSGN